MSILAFGLSSRSVQCANPPRIERKFVTKISCEQTEPRPSLGFEKIVEAIA